MINSTVEMDSLNMKFNNINYFFTTSFDSSFFYEDSHIEQPAVFKKYKIEESSQIFQVATL